MTFKSGDAVVHPIRGAGVVVDVKERKWHGEKDRYYTIRLLGQPATKLMVASNAAKALGLRRVLSPSRMKRLWGVLLGDPERLPDEHKERYQVLKDKLGTGNVFQVAEVVRDMAWRQHQKGRLTTVGKRMYDDGIMLLASEIAAVQGIDFADAEQKLRLRLTENLSSDTVQ
jgi:CarD family transcriptional regulator